MGYEDHPRLKRLVLEPRDRSRIGKVDNPVRIILFLRYENLRSHAVKHLSDPEEVSDFLAGHLSGDTTAVTRAVAELMDLGCPYFSGVYDRPPCRTGPDRCFLFEACAAAATSLEELYLALCDAALAQAAAEPRYAVYESAYGEGRILVFLARGPVTVKANQLPDGMFNVMTCYGGPGRTLEQAALEQARIMSREASDEGIVWMAEDNWGTGPMAASLKPAKPRGKPAKPGHKKELPRNRSYSRGGSKNWREYLDDWS